MVTGLDSSVLANAALDMGAFGYVVKPFESNEVMIDVANALRRRRLELENRLHRENLEDVVRTRTMALQQALEWLERSEKELRLSREETIQRLAIAAECVEAVGGSIRVESTVGLGTSFFVTIPKEPPQTIPSEKPPPAPGPEGLP